MFLSKEQIVAECMKYENVYEDYPFSDKGWCVMRHAENRRVFAWIFERMGNVWVNVKANRAELDFYRQMYSSVVPAYHLNKDNWNSVILDGTVPDDEISQMIYESYNITAKKKK